MRVAKVLSRFFVTPNQIAAEYGLTEAQVNNALAFYFAHASEIEPALAFEQTVESANVERTAPE